MSDFLRKFILAFLIACLPVQGFAMQARMLASPGTAEHPLSQHADSAMTHDCCPHDSTATHDQQPPHVPGGDCSHCPLCGISLTSALIFFQDVAATAILHPAPQPHPTSFYPEQPQRPPLTRHA